jgi:hypothetical protein
MDTGTVQGYACAGVVHVFNGYWRSAGVQSYRSRRKIVQVYKCSAVVLG